MDACTVELQLGELRKKGNNLNCAVYSFYMYCIRSIKCTLLFTYCEKVMQTIIVEYRTLFLQYIAHNVHVTHCNNSKRYCCFPSICHWCIIFAKYWRSDISCSMQEIHYSTLYIDLARCWHTTVMIYQRIRDASSWYIVLAKYLQSTHCTASYNSMWCMT